MAGKNGKSITQNVYDVFDGIKSRDEVNLSPSELEGLNYLLARKQKLRDKLQKNKDNLMVNENTGEVIVEPKDKTKVFIASNDNDRRPKYEQFLEVQSNTDISNELPFALNKQFNVPGNRPTPSSLEYVARKKQKYGQDYKTDVPLETQKEIARKMLKQKDVAKKFNLFKREDLE